jgi:multiple sugar transport system permease protein
MSLWGTGGAMLIFLAALQNVSEELYEASRIDGASRMHQFRHITVPQISPAIFFNLVMGVIGSFQVFDAAYIMTDGGPARSTLFYVLYLYNKAFLDFEMGYASALAWILFVIIFAFTLLVIRSGKIWVYYEGER